MGLFSFLKSDKPAYSDKVWRTKQAAYKGITTDALLAIKQGQIPLVLVCFEASQQNLADFLQEQQVPFFELNTDSVSALMSQDKVVYVCSSQILISSAIVNSALKSLSKKGRLITLMLGHYPLTAGDNKMIEKARELSPESSLTFYSSLDEPIFNLFGGENLIGLLENLGMQEEEAIEHSMVTKSMERARQKLDSMVKHEVTARSQEEWFEKNVSKN
jgi:preprotein translocase subunit SecA